MECQKKRKKEIYFSSSSFCKERETIPASKNIKRKTFRRWLFEFQTLRLLWLLLEGDNMFLFFFSALCWAAAASQPRCDDVDEKRTGVGGWRYGKRKKKKKRNLSGSPHVGEALCH
jgi:saccharopine dehydrogenase-like NADP-dependent oxidoreductase